MQDFGGLESFIPSEGGNSASEQLSEEARQRFQAAQQQNKQLARDEKKAKKRDDRVAEMIQQFLADEKYSHLFQLIARLSARDCPSIFILGIVSLIHKGSKATVDEFIQEKGIVIKGIEDVSMTMQASHLPPESRMLLLEWMSRLELILNIEGEKVIQKLMVDTENIDGSVLQLTTFVLIDFFMIFGREVLYHDLQPLAIKILQDLLQEYMATLAEQQASKETAEEE